MKTKETKVEEKKEGCCDSGYISSLGIWVCIGLFIFLFLCVGSFISHVTTDEVFNKHGLVFDKELMSQIDSLDSLSCSQDIVELKQEVLQLKKLTKYVIERESKYQMEIDLIIDKYSQWTGYWLSIICCVLALFTLIQALVNYRTNNESAKNCRLAADDIKVKYKQLVKDMESSAHQNKLSCISVCLSSFPDAFSLTPNEERQKFIRKFMKMLNEEYANFTHDITKLTDLRNKNGSKLDIRKELDLVYLVWCDISIAVNHAMYDFTRSEQNIAFENLKELLCGAIMDYHDQRINYTNVSCRMIDVMNSIQKLVNVL